MLPPFGALEGRGESRSLRESCFEILDDHVRLVHPLCAVFVVDAQAGHLHPAAALEKSVAVLPLRLCVSQLDRDVESMQSAPGLDAERTGVELVERKVSSFGFNTGLLGFRGRSLPGPGKPADEDDDVAQAVRVFGRAPCAVCGANLEFAEVMLISNSAIAQGGES